MKFPNAEKGIKKIYTAELLKLIANICLIAAVAVGVITLTSTGMVDMESSDISNTSGGEVGAFLGAIVLLAAYVVLTLIAFFINLIGFIKIRNDDENFKTALVFLIINIVLSAISLFNMSSSFGNIVYSLVTLSDTLATIFIIAGGIKIANQLNRDDVSKKGVGMLKLIIIVEAITFVIAFITTFLRGTVSSITASALMLISFALSFVIYVMYLLFLSKTKKMLKEN